MPVFDPQQIRGNRLPDTAKGHGQSWPEVASGQGQSRAVGSAWLRLAAMPFFATSTSVFKPAVLAETIAKVTRNCSKSPVAILLTARY